MKVKICGVKDMETAQFAVQSGADALGFVFADSKRQVSIETAKAIVRNLPKEILKIGVFVNETKDILEEVFEEVGLTHLQLHGDESAEFCKSLRYPVIKVIQVATENDLLNMDQFECEYLLVDSPSGRYRGGNGTTFDWSLLKDKNFPSEKLILAGGLTSENVMEACQYISPFMIDVSSGVETAGVKDFSKINEFIRIVKGGCSDDNLYTSR
jgi:phosphoribosylanthranilate isomerase